MNENWEICAKGSGRFISEVGGRPIYIDGMTVPDSAIHRRQERVVACVNACSTLRDPVGDLKFMREKIEACLPVLREHEVLLAKLDEARTALAQAWDALAVASADLDDLRKAANGAARVNVILKMQDGKRVITAGTFARRASDKASEAAGAVHGALSKLGKVA